LTRGIRNETTESPAIIEGLNILQEQWQGDVY
jgi:hypothetical protein